MPVLLSYYNLLVVSRGRCVTLGCCVSFLCPAHWNGWMFKSWWEEGNSSALPRGAVWHAAWCPLGYSLGSTRQPIRAQPKGWQVNPYRACRPTLPCPLSPGLLETDEGNTKWRGCVHECQAPWPSAPLTRIWLQGRIACSVPRPAGMTSVMGEET